MQIKQTMMKKNGTLGLLIIILALAISNMAATQETRFKLKELMGEKWQGESPKPSLRFGQQFTTTEIKIFMNGEHVATDKYYLSDTIPAFFDDSKIGKNKQGRYLITQAKRTEASSFQKKAQDIETDNFSVSELISYSPNRLETKAINHTGALYIGGGHSVVYYR